MMLLSGGSAFEYNEIKKMSAMDFLSKFDNFTLEKEAEIKAAEKWRNKK